MATDPKYVGVIGATSLVGQVLLPRLVADGYEVKAFTRGGIIAKGSIPGVEWRELVTSPEGGGMQDIDVAIRQWISLAPAWCLSEHFPMLEAYGVRRIVVLSSTSIFTKNESLDLEEQATAHMLAEAESSLRSWAANSGVEWLLLRPTLIYGLGQDKNITEIARFIRRFGFFPIVGKGVGLRQPIHAKDVADVCGAVLERADLMGRAYNLSGGETLTYRNMVARIFVALGQPVRFRSVPVWVFRAAVFILRRFPRYRRWTVSMAVRMNKDLVFDNSDAVRDFAYRPRLFTFSSEDMLGS